MREDSLWSYLPPVSRSPAAGPAAGPAADPAAGPAAGPAAKPSSKAAGMSCRDELRISDLQCAEKDREALAGYGIVSGYEQQEKQMKEFC